VSRNLFASRLTLASMAQLIRTYGSISKVTEQSDGTLIVDGIASTESKDSQGEIIKADAMRAALPSYMKFGNVREMHQAIAAGTALACFVDDAGVTQISAHIVDPVSCKKVSTGVLKGFSIGGSVPPGGRNKDDAKIIEQVNLTEISLVDRPANPDALIQLVKLDAGTPPPDTTTAPPPETTTAPVVKADGVAKGMYQIGWAAELVASINSLAQDTAWEAEYEGDNSPIPARVAAVRNELCSILVAIVAEETNELMGVAPSDELLAMAEQPGSLKKSVRFADLAKSALLSLAGKSPEPVEKAGAKFSKATADAIGAIHKCVQDAHEQLGALGYDKETKDDDGAVAMSVGSGELQKRATDAEALALEASTIAKTAIEERNAIATKLAKAHADLEAARVAAAQRKGALKAVAVAKADDGKSTPTSPALESSDPVALTKSIHAAGGRTVNR
jgi:hypothetical protein